MKKIKITLLSLFVCIGMYGQDGELSALSNILSLSYDAAGNRIHRQVITFNGNRLADTSSTSSYLDEMVVIYPNPTKGKLSIELTNFEDLESSFYVEVFDSRGRLLFTKGITNQLTTIDISSQQNGVYFLNITGEHKSSNWQIIKN